MEDDLRDCLIVFKG